MIASMRSLAHCGRGAVAAITLAGLLVAHGAARAERADRDQPANVTADHSTLDDLHQVEVLTGHVVLIKGTMHLTGDRMVHRQDPEGYQFYVVTAAPEELATFHERRDPVREGVESTLDGWAETIEYDDKSDRVTLTRRALVKRFENEKQRDELSGERIVYDARKSTYEVESHIVDGKGPRVTMIISPRSNAQAAPAPAPGAAVPAPPTLTPDRKSLPEGAH